MDKLFGELLKHLEYVPKYFSVFAGVLLRPRQYLAALPPDDDEQLGPSLVFLAVTCVFLILANLPFAAAKESSLVFIAARGAIIAVAMILYALVVHLAWRIVGGKETFLRCFILSNYISSVASIMLLFFVLTALSSIIVFDADLYQDIFVMHQAPQLLTQRQLVLLLANDVFVAAGIIATSIWFGFAWGAYREVNRVSRFRSFLAFCIAGFLVLPVFAVTYVISDAIGIIAQRP